MTEGLAIGLLAFVFGSDIRAHDLMMFPNKQCANESLDFAVKHCEWLAQQRQFIGEDRQAWREDAAWCKRAWDLLDSAHRSWDGSKVDNLRRMRDHIGHEAYYRGEMPPPVPVWRFRRIN